MKLDRSKDKKRAQVLDNVPVVSLGTFDGRKNPRHWHLVAISVEPEEQGQKIGKALLEYGFDLARKDDLPLLLTSVPGTRSFYEKSGFQAYEHWSLDHLTWHAMFWQPPRTGTIVKSQRPVVS